MDIRQGIDDLKMLAKRLFARVGLSVSGRQSGRCPAKACVLALCVFALTGCASDLSDGLDALENGNYEDAVTSFTEAVEEDGESGEAWRGLGLAYWELGDTENAAEALKKAVKYSDEALGSTYNILAAIELQAGEYESALTYIEKAGNCVGNSDELTQELAHNEIVCYERLGKWDEAKEKMQAYQENYPDDDSLSRDAEFLSTR